MFQRFKWSISILNTEVSILLLVASVGNLYLFHDRLVPQIIKMDHRQLPSIDFDEESRGERFIRKSKEAPYVPLGIYSIIYLLNYS